MKELKLRLVIFILLLLGLFLSCGTIQTYNGIIPLHEQYELHFLNVKINGHKARLLLDTGASKSLLDIRKAEEFGFEYILLSKDKYIGIGGRQDIYILYGYEVVPFHIAFLGCDLSEIAGYFDGKIPIDGILGMDFLERTNAKIDFKLNKVYLHDSDTIEIQIIGK